MVVLVTEFPDVRWAPKYLKSWTTSILALMCPHQVLSSHTVFCLLLASS